jgi:hypothetical protein
MGKRGCWGLKMGQTVGKKFRLRRSKDFFNKIGLRYLGENKFKTGCTVNLIPFFVPFFIGGKVYIEKIEGFL